jgi:hypothetical protein
MAIRRKPTDWHKRYRSAKGPHVVTLHTDFAGVRAGMQMLISSPAEIAEYVARIPRGETRTIPRLRSDLAHRAKADAMCPVTTAIYLKIVAEVALAELASGKDLGAVAPFWRVVAPSSKLAARLSCGREGVEHLSRLDGLSVADEAQADIQS